MEGPFFFRKGGTGITFDKVDVIFKVRGNNMVLLIMDQREWAVDIGSI